MDPHIASLCIAIHDIWSPWYSTYYDKLVSMNIPSCVTARRDRVAGKDLWTHFFQEVQKSLSAPPGGRETIKPYPGGCMALWVYRDVSPESGTNQDSIFQMKSKLWIWPPLPLLELETKVREDFTIMEKAPALLGPSPSLKCLLALSQ